MQLFKRISSTVLSSVEQAVSQIENHDAVVESMIKDLHHVAADTKVRLRRVQRDGQEMRQRLQELKDEEIIWTQRAIRCTNAENPDETKALACLDRRRQCRQEISRLDVSLKQHIEIENKLAVQQRKIEQQKNEMNQQRHLLKSKEAMVDAKRVAVAVSGGSYGDISDAFDRWEVAISKSEYANDDLADDNLFEVDELDREFTEREMDLSLQAELDELKNSHIS